MGGVIGWIVDVVSKWAKELIAAAVLAVLTAVGLIAWGQVKSSIVQIVADDLQSASGKLDAPFATAMGRHQDLAVQTIAAELVRNPQTNRVLDPLRTALY